MRRALHFPLISALLTSGLCLAQLAPVDQVDPLIGTSGDGQTYPAVGVPFGMTQWTAETRTGEKKCVAPYYMEDKRIYGFRGSHFMSGSCTQDYGSLTLMPLNGAPGVQPIRLSSAFRHVDEVRKPYFYSVDLLDSGIRVEMTGTVRSGLLRFRFGPSGGSILVQSNARKGDGEIHIDRARGEVAGSNDVRRLYAGAGQPAGFRGYFVVQFNHPFRVAGTWSRPPSAEGDLLTADALQRGRLEQRGAAGAPGVVISFAPRPGEWVEARIGTSFSSLKDARRNLAVEIPGWNFAAVSAHARSAWSDELDRIQIAGNGSPEKTIFYTALYHSMLLPRIFSDVSGHHPRFGGGGMETARGYTYYCDFSLWDTFRAVHPLLTILDPSRDSDMVRSLLEMGREGGFLPIYPAWSSYTSEMIGDHADAVIVDAYRKGIRGFDPQEAYALMRRNAMEEPATEALYKDGRGRRALKSYLRYGYIPLEDHVPDAFHHNEQVSRTLEYAYDDFLVGEMAEALGETGDAQLFKRRAQNYRNVIDPADGFARGRYANGSWETPFQPEANNSAFTEANSYQYTFFVPQDINGLIAAVHGPSAFEAKLDGLFTSGSYAQGNEPSHQIAYLYDYIGKAWKTQGHIHDILRANYRDDPSGLPGNDDAGQMSAWYVLSALGFYPVTPGIPTYAIGTPSFDHTTIFLPHGRHFQLEAPGAKSGMFYIQSVSVNGKPLTQLFLSHAALLAGGKLTFSMSRQPVKAP